MGKVKRKKIVKSKSKLILVALKMLPSEYKALRAKARKHADGNFSAWIRHAGSRYKPKRGEVIVSVTMPGVKNKRLTPRAKSMRR